jgi:HlyD family secretion protein
MNDNAGPGTSPHNSNASATRASTLNANAVAKSRARRWRWWLIAGMVLIMLIGAIVAPTFKSKQQRAAVTIAKDAPPTTVVGLGYLEPASTLVTIGTPGGGDAARIASLQVVEGQEVEQGEIIAVLDTADRLNAQRKASQSQIDLKRLALQRQRLDMVNAIASRRAAVTRARADLDTAAAELKRQEDLVAQGFTSPSALQSKRREFLNAEATLEETSAALRRAETTTAASAHSSSSEFIDVAMVLRELAAAEADLAVTRANLDLATIRAPFKGRITAINARPGERIGNDGVVEMGATDNMRAVIEVYQSDIDRIRLNQSAELRADALTQTFAGKVERIGIAIKRQTVVNNDPATATDARVVEVFVALDADTSRKLSAYSRLQVRAKFK